MRDWRNLLTRIVKKGAREVDAIVQSNDDRSAAFEVKLSEGRANAGARNLLRLAPPQYAHVLSPGRALTGLPPRP